MDIDENHPNAYAVSPILGLARLLSIEPDFLKGRIGQINLPEIQKENDTAANATDLLLQKFEHAVGAIGVNAVGHPENYDLNETRNYDPEKDRVVFEGYHFANEEGLQRFKDNVMRAVRYFCNGDEEYMALLIEALHEMEARGDTIHGSYELLEKMILEDQLERSNGVGKLYFTDSPEI